MNAIQWETADDPAVMYQSAGISAAGTRGRPDRIRKERLYMCACCRTAFGLMPPVARQAVMATEHVLLGLLGEEKLDGYREMLEADNTCQWWQPWNMDNAPARLAAWATASPGVTGSSIMGVFLRPWGYRVVPREVQASLLREIYGNPLAPLRLPAECLQPHIAGMAREVYKHRKESGTLDRSRLLVLSDALEEAGVPSYERRDRPCPNCGGSGYLLDRQTSQSWLMCMTCRETGKVTETVESEALAHLRAPGPHYLGCYVIEAIIAATKEMEA